MNSIQYTIRNIPPAVDRVIRKRAAQSGKSFNQTVIELLALQTFGTIKPKTDDSFDFLFGKAEFDEAFDEAMRDFSKVDEAFWQ